MTAKHRVKAKIAGKEYTIVAQRSSEHITAVVELVNQQLEQLKELDPSLSKEDRSILMAVNAMSDQLIKAERIIELEAEVEQLKGHTSNVTKSNSLTQDSIDTNSSSHWKSQSKEARSNNPQKVSKSLQDSPYQADDKRRSRLVSQQEKLFPDEEEDIRAEAVYNNPTSQTTAKVNKQVSPSTQAHRGQRKDRIPFERERQSK